MPDGQLKSTAPAGAVDSLTGICPATVCVSLTVLSMNPMTSTLLRLVISTPARTAFCLFLAGSLSGCGGGTVEGTGTTASGKVEFDGQPIPAGTVTFLHHDSGNFVGCEIDDGYYSGEGPYPGKNTLMIMGKETSDGDPMWQDPWKKVIDVGDSEFAEDFSIASDDVEPFDPSTRVEDEDLKELGL